jgi:hypothetical protein
MSNRAWRNTRDAVGTGQRELYPTDQAAGNEDFKLPSLVKAFTITVPDGMFGANAGNFLVAILELRAHYKFS